MKYYGILKQPNIRKREFLLSSDNISFYKHLMEKYTVVNKKRFFKLEHLFHKSKNSIIQKSIFNQRRYFQNFSINQQSYFTHFKTELRSTAKQYLNYLRTTPNEIIRTRDITQLENILKTVTAKNKNITEHIHTLSLVQKNSFQKEQTFETNSLHTVQLIHTNKMQTSSVKRKEIVNKEITIEKEVHTKEMIENLVKERVEQELKAQKKLEVKEVSENIYTVIMNKWQKDMERRGVFHG